MKEADSAAFTRQHHSRSGLMGQGFCPLGMGGCAVQDAGSHLLDRNAQSPFGLGHQALHGGTLTPPLRQ
ncbi:hypothetical protein AB1N83_009013 [Pleurotus pulmonarius]